MAEHLQSIDWREWSTRSRVVVKTLLMTRGYASSRGVTVTGMVYLHAVEAGLQSVILLSNLQHGIFPHSHC